MKKRLLYLSLVLIASWLIFVSLPFKWVPEQGWLNGLYHASWGVFFDIGIGDVLDNQILPFVYTGFVNALDSVKNLNFRFWGGILFSFGPLVGLIILSKFETNRKKKKTLVSKGIFEKNNNQDEVPSSDNDNALPAGMNRENVIFEEFKKFLDSPLSGSRENMLRVIAEIGKVNLTDAEEARLDEMMLREAWIREGVLSLSLIHI